MKNMYITGFLAIAISLFGEVSASELKGSSINVYGAGEKVSERSYNGAGAQFENDSANVIIEGGSDYKKASAVLKYDITKDIYIKGGIASLEREMSIEEVLTDVKQNTFGLGLGFGNSKTYNIEAGFLVYDLSGASRADGKAETTYLELILQHSFTEHATFDLAGSYKNTKVFDKNYDDYSVELGYFPTDDIRFNVRHDSVTHNKNDYTVNAGIKYTFEAKQPWSPYFKGNKNFSENNSGGIEYSKGIIERSLKMRDTFEKSIATSSIVAKEVAPDIFEAKIAKPIVINKTAPTLSSTTQTFTTTVGTALTLVTVTANDDVDGSVAVVQSGDTVDFNTEGTYKVVYTATDKDGNANSITHTYVVGAAPISTPTISFGNNSVNDEGGGDVTVGTPTVSNVEAGAVYEMVGDPTSGMLTINSSTGAMTWNGDVDGNQNFNITIKVTNTDTGNKSDTFVLTVNDNL